MNIKNSLLSRRFISLGILAIIVIGGLMAFVWWYGHGVLVLNPDKQAKNTTYTVTSQPANKSSQLTGSATISKTLQKGSYEIIASAGEGTFLGFTKVPGFLAKTTVTTKLTPERGRRFVGNNPSSCMNLVEAVLVSYSCGGSYSSLRVHVPATTQLPTYTTSNVNGFTQNIEGIVSTKQGNYMVLRSLEDVGLSTTHTAYKLSGASSTTSPTGGISLSGMENSKDYAVSAYQGGFITYDQTLRQVIYYNPPLLKQQLLDTGSPDKSSPIPISLDSHQDSIVKVYSNTVTDTSDGKAGVSPRVQIILYKGGKTKSFYLYNSMSRVKLCGQDRLCALDGEGMHVYDTSGKKLRATFSMLGVTSIDRAGNGIVARRNRDVFFIDTKLATGFRVYALGDYQFVGFSSADHGSLLTLTNSNGKNVVLYVDLDTQNADSIDKKISTLLHTPSITDVSTYGNIVYIAPNYGEMVYSDQLKMFTYDPAVQSRVNADISAAVAKSAIDTGLYKIINPYQPK